MKHTKMGKVWLFLGMVSLFLTGCGGNSEQPTDLPEKPENLLSEEKMANLLLETQLLEAKLMENKSGISQDSSLSLFKVYEEKIFKENDTDSITFYQSHNYYSSDLLAYQRIITLVHDSITKLREAAKEKETEELANKGKK